MNFFILIKSKANYPLQFSLSNSINGSYIGIGKFINEDIVSPLIYEDADNSKIPYENLIELDVLETVGGGLLISERFKDLIEEHFKSDVQIFNTTFVYKGVKNENYFALNIFNKVECYDLDKSVYTKHPVDGSFKFIKSVLNKTPLEEYGYEYNIARSIYDNKIVASELFKSLVESNKINSVGFKK